MDFTTSELAYLRVGNGQSRSIATWERQRSHSDEQDAASAEENASRDEETGENSDNAVSAVCEKCVKSYAILDLSQGAGRDEIKKKRAFVEFLYPDQLGNKSESARHAAKEQLKRINQACDQILQCPSCSVNLPL